MSVNPGYGGQQFIEQTYRKMAALEMLLARRREDILVVVDGGVTPGNAELLAAAGADVLVAGTAVFGAGDYARAVDELRAAALAGAGAAGDRE